MKRFRWMLVGVGTLTALSLLPAAATKTGDTESKTQPGLFYRCTKSFDGAITKDDFAGKEPDPKLWEIRQTPELPVFYEGGTLHIKGTWPKDPRNTGGMIGAFSKSAHSPRTRMLNAVMAAKVKFNHEWKQEGFERSPTMEFHFCGTGPDINVSIARSWRPDKVAWGLAGGGGLGSTKRFPPVPRDDAAIAQLDDHQWQTLFISDHRGVQNAYIVGQDGKWLRVGGPVVNWINNKRIELKVMHGIPGYKTDVEFDDARLYPYPADNPVRVAVYVHDSQDPRLTWPFTVKLVSEDGKRVLAEAAGGPGGDLLDLTLPADILYPIAARIQVFRGDKLDAEFPIEAKGVNGLYPGDIWEVYCIPPPRTTRPA